MIVNDEGDIYCFPFLRGDNSLMVFQGPIVRKDWLDKLGIPMPETIDDWYAMLQAFRDKDPNGNGKKDDVPFTTMLYGSPLDSFTAASVPAHSSAPGTPPGASTRTAAKRSTVHWIRSSRIS